MVNKNALLRISALKLAGKIESMSERSYSIYIQTMNSFIDQFPNQASMMNAALEEKKYDNVRKTLMDVSSALIRLHADDLAEECRRILNSLVGSIDHDSAEALLVSFIQGVSTLSIDIQMAMRDTTGGGPVQQRAAPMPSAARPGGRPLILAVDNAIMFLNTLKRLLQDAPYDLECVTSGDKALSYINENPSPSLFLLDIEMPGMDGYELARRLKQSGVRAPILFITANSEREYVEKAVEVGAAGLLVKPLRAPLLLAKIKEFI